MDSELMIIALFFIGTSILLLIIGAYGLLKDGMDETESDEHSDIRIRGNGVSDHDSYLDRYNPPDQEEIINVLWVLRLGASAREKRVIDYLLYKEGDID